jgi:hypothetical protein
LWPDCSPRSTPEPVSPLGVALVAELLSDSESALYQVDGNLASAVGSSVAALDSHIA